MNTEQAMNTFANIIDELLEECFLLLTNEEQEALRAGATALREKAERENPKPQSGVKGMWIEEDDDEIEITVHRRDKPVRICVGTGDVVIVEKIYGPAVLEDLRIECTFHGWKVSGDDVILESVT